MAESRLSDMVTETVTAIEAAEHRDTAKIVAIEFLWWAAGDYLSEPGSSRWRLDDGKAMVSRAGVARWGFPDGWLTWLDERRARGYVESVDAVASTIRLRVAATELVESERSAAAVTDAFAKAGAPVGLSEFLAEPDLPVPYLIEGLMTPASRVLLAAGAKAGKTHIALELSRALTTATPFLARFTVTEPRAVLYVNLELAPGMLRMWVRQIGGHPERTAVWDLRGRAGVLDFRVPEARHAISETISDLARRTGSRVSVVIDVIGQVWDALGISENHNDEVGPYLAGVDALMAETMALSEMVMVHHFGHLAERARGASKLLGWPEGLWSYYVKEPEDGQDSDERPRFLRIEGRDVALSESVVQYDPASRRLTMKADAGGRARYRHERAVSEVVAYLQTTTDDSQRTQNKLVSGVTERGIETSQRTIIAAIKTAIERGIIAVEVGASRAVIHRLSSHGLGFDPFRDPSEGAGETRETRETGDAFQVVSHPIGDVTPPSPPEERVSETRDVSPLAPSSVRLSDKLCQYAGGCGEFAVLGGIVCPAHHGQRARGAADHDE